MRFLEVVALSNGEEINYSNISSDCGVPVRTIEGHFGILSDTLIGLRSRHFYLRQNVKQ